MFLESTELDVFETCSEHPGQRFLVCCPQCREKEQRKVKVSDHLKKKMWAELNLIFGKEKADEWLDRHKDSIVMLDPRHPEKFYLKEEEGTHAE